MPALGGYAGKFLFVNLTKNTLERKSLNWDYAQDVIGGCGYAARLLYDRLNLECLDPFHPENEIAIFTGPLTATGAPCTGRHSICTKSALTEIWGESTGGGFFGAELRSSGLDGILITGAAKNPVFLEIHDDVVNLNSADHLWGKDTFETEDIIKRDAKDKKIRVLTIGPAGENRVRFAAVMNDKGRASARAGAGAVFGAKQLKAIAVRGTGKIEVTQPEQFREHSNTARQFLQDLIPILGVNGTAYPIDMFMNLFGNMPVRYFSETSMPVTTLNAEALNSYKTKRFHCHLCPIGCGPIITVETDKVHLQEVSGPELETIATLGTFCKVTDLAAICQANHLCNLLGMDTISTGNIIAFTFAANEQGKLPSDLCRSLNLKFGEAESVVQLVEMIGRREGLGNLLAEGVKRAADYLNASDLALHVKGLEIPLHDPRAFFGFATTYATSPTGAHHMQGDIITVTLGVEIPEFEIEATERHVDEGKGIAVAKFQSWRTLYNSLLLCQLAIMEPLLVTNLYNTATGKNLTPHHLFEIGRRTIALKRAFNIRCGITAEDDVLPTDVVTPFQNGLNAGKSPNLTHQLKEFYQYNEWDPATGKPTRKILVELGLADVADQLWS